jgi:hypothetical protein
MHSVCRIWNDKWECYTGLPESYVEDWFLEHYRELGFDQIEPTRNYPSLNTCDAGDYVGVRDSKRYVIELEAYSSAAFLHNIDRLRTFDYVICYYAYECNLPRFRDLGINIIVLTKQINELLDPINHRKSMWDVSEKEMEEALSRF